MINDFFMVFAAVFSVVDPFGAIPVFISMTPDWTEHERAKTAFATSLYFVIILVAFFFAGGLILGFFGITLNSIRIAGGLVILQSGFSLLQGKFSESRAYSEKVKAEALEKEDISFTPLAMPLLSGPGSISLLISYHEQYSGVVGHGMVVSSVILVGVFIYFMLRYSPRLFKRIGYGGLKAISRIMGFIVMAIGVQFIVVGIVELVEKVM